MSASHSAKWVNSQSGVMPQNGIHRDHLDAARSVIEGYFKALEAGDVDRVLEFFTKNARYVHPAWPGETDVPLLHEAVGHEALRRLLVHRGARDLHHQIHRMEQSGSTFHVWGIVCRDGKSAEPFRAHAELDAGEPNRLSWYIGHRGACMANSCPRS